MQKQVSAITFFIEMGAIALDDEGFAEQAENACIGCGVCARFCPDALFHSRNDCGRSMYSRPEYGRKDNGGGSAKNPRRSATITI